MKILFLTYHGFSDYSGISKKIHYQLKGLRQNGYDARLCYYGFTPEGHRCRFIDDDVIKDYGTGWTAALHQRMSYGCIYDYCLREGIQMVYARCFQNASPWLIRLFSRLRKAGIKAVTEIPTYPYDQEFCHAVMKQRIGLWCDKLFRRRLYRQMEALVTFSDATEIFGQRTINISNGVDMDSIPLHQPPADHHSLHLIGVAEVHFWHGYDRLVEGLGRYYQTTEKPKNVVLHIVGGIWPGDMHGERGFQTLIDRYGLNGKIVLHGQLFGQQLDDVFNQCRFAIGSLGRHRSGITTIKTLKNREYATRGIPFIYSEQDSDFDRQPYVLKATADESPIDIQQIVDFTDRFTMKPADIRQTVEHLTWQRQMRIVVEATMGNGQQSA